MNDDVQETLEAALSALTQVQEDLLTQYGRLKCVPIWDMYVQSCENTEAFRVLMKSIG